MDVGGLIAAIFAAVFNGSFGVLSKIKRVQEAQVSESFFPESKNDPKLLGCKENV